MLSLFEQYDEFPYSSLQFIKVVQTWQCKYIIRLALNHLCPPVISLTWWNCTGRYLNRICLGNTSIISYLWQKLAFKYKNPNIRHLNKVYALHGTFQQYRLPSLSPTRWMIFVDGDYLIWRYSTTILQQ